MQTRCVYCKVGTELLYISYTDWGFNSGRAIAQAFSRRPPLRKPGFDPRSVHMRFVVDKMTLGQVFLQVLRCFPCQYQSTNALLSSSCTSCSYQKDKRAEAGNLPKSNALSDIGEQRKVLSLWGGGGKLQLVKCK
jgi:hypothetical protein